MTQAQSERPAANVLTRALAAMQTSLVEERMQRLALELEVDRLTQVCSKQTLENEHLRERLAQAELG